MKRLKILIALAMGIMASSSGMIQASAALYTFSVDFNTKEVANFSAFKQTFSTDTYNLEGRINFQWSGFYKFDSCPTAFIMNPVWIANYQINATGTTFTFPNQELPDMPCTTTYTSFSATSFHIVPDQFIQQIMNDDANFIRLNSAVTFRSQTSIIGRTLSLINYRNFFNVSYDFNTTYLFNYFLSDQQFVQRINTTGTGGTWTINSTREVYLQYVYTTAGNDEYRLVNSNPSDITNLRKKYALDYNQEFFRGESVGAQFNVSHIDLADTYLFGSGSGSITWVYNYHYLNVANLAQAIVDAPVFDFEYDDCGSFLALNVGCFINNAFAYITNDAPIVSDAFTLLNAGIEMAAQTFGIIGEFADDNVFGVLVLAGFGFIAVKWFLKND